jgi:hypothetical protein
MSMKGGGKMSMNTWVERLLIVVGSILFGLVSVMDLGLMMMILLLYVNIKANKTH